MSSTEPASRFRLHNGQLGGVAIIAALIAWFSFAPLWHTDIWAHAKYGEWYWSHRTVPTEEPLSPFSDKSVPFANVAWLSQVAYYGLYHLGASVAGGDAESQLFGGIESLRIFHLLLLTGRFAFLWMALRRFGGSCSWATVGIALYALAMRQEVVIQRPQSLGVFFLTVVLFALSSQALSRRAVFWLPLVFLLWANSHGTFVVGLAVIGLHTLGRAIELGLRNREVWRLVLVGFMCGLATLINPHGPILYKHVLTFSGHPNLQSMTEWWPMKWAASGAYWMSIVLLAFVRLLGNRKVGAAGWLVALPFAIWPWLQWRSILWWWTIAVWLLARIGPGLGDKFMGIPGMPDGERTRGKFLLAIAIVLVAIAVMPEFRSSGIENSVARDMPWRIALELNAKPLDEGRWLPELRQAIRQHFPEGRYQGSIFASETQGDFLIWALSNDQPVLMYTHAHVFTFAYWEACRDVKSANPGWQEFLIGHRANLIVVESNTHEELVEAVRENPEWRVVQDGVVLIAIRANTPN